MPKGVQRSNKEARKPKKDVSPPRPASPPGEPGPSFAITTVIPERGKKKNKPG